MRTSRIIVPVAALLFHGQSLAQQQVPPEQQVEFRGRVLDAVNGEPLIGAVVRLPDLQRYTLTGEGGWFRMQVPAGLHQVTVAQLGYASDALTLRVDGVTVHTLRIEPSPIQLERIVVHNDFLDRRAKRTAHGSRSGFYQVYDRADVLGSGAADPLEFLRKSAHIAIRKCSYAQDLRNGRTLCVDAPFIAANTGMQQIQVRALTRFPGTSRNVGGGLSPMSRLTKTDILRMGGRLPPVRPSPSRPVPVYVDDAPLRGSFDSLTAKLALQDVYRVESFGARGEEQIRFYTLDYIAAISAGQLRPPTDITLPGDRFDDWLWREPDWLRDQVRRNRCILRC